MIPSEQVSQRQTTQRHRRSDRYAQEQAPAAQQPAAQGPYAPPSSVRGSAQAPVQGYPQQQPQRMQPQRPVSTPQPTHQTGTRMQPPQQPQGTPQAQPYQMSPRMQPPQQQGMPAPREAYPQQGMPPQHQTSPRMQPPQQQPPREAYPQQGVPQQHQTSPRMQAPQQPQQGMQQPMRQPAREAYPPQGMYYPYPQAPMDAWPQDQRQQPTRMAMNGQPAPVPVPPSGYAWESAGQPHGGQGGWQQTYHGPSQTPSGGDDAPQPMPVPFLHNPRQHHGDGTDGRPQRRYLWLIAVAALAVTLLAVGGAFGVRRAVEEQQVRDYVAGYDDRFCDGVYVDGIHLGGMTQQEGYDAVAAQAQQRNNSWYVRLTYQGQTVVQLGAVDLGMQVNVTDAMREAWRQGHTSTDVHEREAEMQQLRENPYYGYTLLPQGDTSVVDSVLDELSARVYRAPQDAVLLEFDPAKTYPFTFQEEVPGQMLNTDNLKTDIYRMVSTMESGELEIHLDVIPPSVTVAQLQETVALRGDEYTEISTSSTENRNNNIRRAFELISGTVIPPGGTFSFNGVVGKRTTERGFYPAVEYVYGKEKEGIGGGVCQASTTIYLAAVAANLEITKHTPHSMQVGYTTYGKDATVNMDGKQIDFCFRNNTEGNIYIAASVQYAPNSSKRWICRVRIYGMSLGAGVSYKLEAEEVETIPIPEEPVYRKDTDATYVTYTDEEYEVKGREGHITESYCVKYVNGVEESRTFLFRDVYNAAAPTIYRGTKERPY